MTQYDTFRIGTFSFSKGNDVNKFNENIQIEETTEFKDSEVMNELNNGQQFTSMAHKRRVERLQEDFQLTAPEGENQDEDSLGELSTNVIDDSRDLIDVDEPVDYYGAYGDYEDYEPSPYDGTYSEM